MMFARKAYGIAMSRAALSVRGIDLHAAGGPGLCELRVLSGRRVPHHPGLRVRRVPHTLLLSGVLDLPRVLAMRVFALPILGMPCVPRVLAMCVFALRILGMPCVRRMLALSIFAFMSIGAERAWADVSPSVTPPSVESLVAAIDACRERLDPQIDIGFERIVARCPDLARRLEQNELAAWLPEGWKDAGNNLSVGSLQELAVLMRREIATHSSRPAPSVQHLHDVLSEIGQAPEKRDSLWKRMRLWMNKVLPSSDEPGDNGWVPRMISRIGLPQTVIEMVSYLALTLILVLGLFILANEFRAAGFFHRRGPRKANEAPSAEPTIQQMSWSDVERAAPTDKARVVLELVIDRLTRARLLPPARSLTNRELTRAVKLPNAKDQERLQILALTAERMRYAATRVDAAEVESAVAGGRVILRSLDPAIEDESSR